jgi:3-dehydroquinate synthase
VSRQALESALSGLLEERRGFYSKAHMTVDTRRKSPFQVAMDVARQVGADGPGQVCADGPGQVCADGPGQVGAGGPGQVGADGPGQAVAARIAGFGDVNGGREGILPLGERSYPVRISQLAGFSGLGGFLDEVLPTSDRFVLVDEQVLGLYEQSLRRALQPGPVRFIPLPSGEEAKSLSRTEECLERLLLAGATRSSAVVAVGGGSALDAAGFAASIYMRSIPVVYVPTTLLAAVDAGIGGKNGVNLRQGKNMAGTIFQPRGVFVPLRVVEKEVETRGGHDGAAELLKICLIAGEPFDRIRTLARRGGRIRASRLAEAVELAAACKMAIVSRDERDDKGERVVLNLGHTFAHMAETASRYRVSHGRAVAWGLVVAARVSVGLGMVPAGFETRVEELCRHFGLWPPPMALPVELLQGPLLDKKRVGGTLPLVLFGKAGRPVVTRFGVEEAGKLLLSGMSPILVPGA